MHTYVKCWIILCIIQYDISILTQNYVVNIHYCIAYFHVFMNSETRNVEKEKLHSKVTHFPTI